jgi:hypothetical protein
MNNDEFGRSFWDRPTTRGLVREDLEEDRGTGDFKTPGDFASEIVKRFDAGARPDDDAFCEFLDREFFYGHWKDLVERLPIQGKTFLANIRGLLFATYLAGRSQHTPEQVNEFDTELAELRARVEALEKRRQ